MAVDVRTDSGISSPEGWRVRVYQRIFSYVLESWRGVAATLTFTLASALLAVLSPWPIKLAIDGLLDSQRLELPLGVYISTDGTRARVLSTIALAVAYFAITAGSATMAGMAIYCGARTAQGMTHRLRSRLMDHMRGLSLRWHTSQAVGDTIWRAINDARSFQELLLFGIRTWGSLVFRVTLMIIFMFLLDPLLALLVIAVVPPLLLTIRILTAPIQRTALHMRQALSRLTSLIEESMSAISAIKIFGRETTEQLRFNHVSLDVVHATIRWRIAEQTLLVATVLITAAGSAIVFGVAVARVGAGLLSVGSLWVFMTYTQAIYTTMNEIVASFGPFQDAVVGVGRVFQVLDETADVQEDRDPIPLHRLNHCIALNDITFGYDPDRPVINNLSFHISLGQRIALVGPTGSGKSTLLALLTRLYDVNHGEITIDGINVRRLRVNSLRELFAVAPQQVKLFSTTARENIRYGRLNASDELVIAAARSAQAHEFIDQLPDGYDTHLGEKGVKLSVGQQQRISIARAFLKESPVLLLDEPTSSLDLRTESGLLDSIRRLMESRTVVMVTHRLSTIRNADMIYFLDEGRIVEQGTHQELMERRGHYYQLYTLQLIEGESMYQVI